MLGAYKTCNLSRVASFVGFEHDFEFLLSTNKCQPSNSNSGGFDGWRQPCNLQSSRIAQEWRSRPVARSCEKSLEEPKHKKSEGTDHRRTHHWCWASNANARHKAKALRRGSSPKSMCRLYSFQKFRNPNMSSASSPGKRLPFIIMNHLLYWIIYPNSTSPYFAYHIH